MTGESGTRLASLSIFGEPAMRDRPTRGLWTLIVAVAVLSAPLSAFAGRIDAADAAQANIADSNYYQNGMDGQWWHAPDSLGVGPSTSSVGSDLVLDFGSGAASGMKFLFQQDGKVLFLNSAGVATGDFLDPLHAASGYASAYSNGHYTSGLLDPSYLTATSLPFGAFNPAKGLNAFRFAWDGICPLSQYNGSVCSPTGFVFFQALIIEIDPEDFQVQFNYQNNAAALAGDTFTSSIRIDGVTQTYNGPFLSAGPNFCFHAGAAVDCNTIISTTVPEPSTAPLAAIGALALATVAWRRRAVALLSRIPR